MREYETKHITKTKLKCVAKEHKSLEPCALFHHPFCHHVRAHTHTLSLSCSLVEDWEWLVGWLGGPRWQYACLNSLVPWLQRLWKLLTLDIYHQYALLLGLKKISLLVHRVCMFDWGVQWHFLHWKNRTRVSEQIYENIDLCSQVLKKHPQRKRKKGSKTSKVSCC